MVLVIDNYDSFTYNIVRYLEELGAEVSVVKNDEISVKQIANSGARQIVISPGPCTPKEAGVSLEVVAYFSGKLPLLGVCLGHQCIAQSHGALIRRARDVMHGKTSAVRHNGSDIFEGLPQGFSATRYHSLVVDRTSLPSNIEQTAWVEDGAQACAELMAIKIKARQIYGIQFHPESILSEHGHRLLQNFLRVRETSV